MGTCWTCQQDNCDDIDVRVARGSVQCSCPCHKPEVKEPIAVFYAVRNDKGEYFKTCSSHSPSRWVKDLSTARIYSTLGTARAKVTALANLKWNANKPIADIVEFVVTDVRVIDQKERVAGSQVKKARKEAERQVRLDKWRLEGAQQEFDRAQRELHRLSRRQ